MGQQQLLLIILGVIIVGIAIAVGITMFSAQAISSNKDAILADVNNLGADAFQFKIRPLAMGGGAGVYTGYAVKPLGAWGTNNPNATYTVSVTPDQITVVGTSKAYTATVTSVTIVFDANGKGGLPTYIGEFL
ncbi:MAG: hypothetical protein ABIK27_04560 [Bacteroidota bacterium]